MYLSCRRGKEKKSNFRWFLQRSIVPWKSNWCWHKTFECVYSGSQWTRRTLLYEETAQWKFRYCSKILVFVEKSHFDGNLCELDSVKDFNECEVEEKANIVFIGCNIIQMWLTLQIRFYLVPDVRKTENLPICSLAQMGSKWGIRLPPPIFHIISYATVAHK